MYNYLNVLQSFSTRLVMITHSASRDNYRCEVVVFDGCDTRYAGDIPHAGGHWFVTIHW